MAGTAGPRRSVMVAALTQRRAKIAQALEDAGIEVAAASPGGDDVVRAVEVERPDALIVDTKVLRKAGGDTRTPSC
jgi:DNA-binding response OmpR family regulator